MVAVSCFMRADCKAFLVPHRTPAVYSCLCTGRVNQFMHAYRVYYFASLCPSTETGHLTHRIESSWSGASAATKSISHSDTTYRTQAETDLPSKSRFHLTMPSNGNRPAAYKVTPPYQYQALPPGSYIRILHLQPGRAGDRLICSLQVASLDEVAGRYDALSYEWGPPSQVCAIEVDGCLLYIRSNLYSYLNLIREQEEVIRTWVDAICIDQSSVDEKNEQVQQMWVVYCNAATTRVFLNTDVDCPKLWDERWSYLVDRRTLIARQAVTKVLEASYWTRLWVVQEIIASDEIIVHVSASKSISWTDFYEQCSMVADRLSKVNSVWSTEAALDKLAKSGLAHLHGHRGGAQLTPSIQRGKGSHKRRKTVISREWAELITTYGRKQCLDIRDHVYGLNGVAAVPVQVDYGLHALEVFASVMNAGDDSRSVRYAEHFAENLWRALGLNHVELMAVQMYPSLLHVSGYNVPISARQRGSSSIARLGGVGTMKSTTTCSL